MERKLTSILACGAALFLGASASAQIAFDPAANFPVGLQPDTAAIGDLDGDLDMDIAVTTDVPDKVDLLFNDGNGNFSGPVSVLTGGGTGPAAIVARDFTGDGATDLAVTLHNVNQVRILVNNGSGGFTLGSSATVGLEPRHMAAGDVDNDGDVDIVTSNRDANTVSVVRNQGGGILGPATSYPAGLEPRAVTMGDFDGNGFLDIAAASHDSREVSVLFNNGNGTFSGPVALSVGPQLRPEGVTAADLDGDMDVDIAAGTEGNGVSFATVFLNLGGGVFSGPSNFPVIGAEPGSILAADLDVDGAMDLATANEDTNNVSALHGNGNGTFGAAVLFAVGTFPDHVAGADLNGDGSTDLVTANRNANSVSVLLNQNAGETGPGVPFCDCAASGPCGNNGAPGHGCANGSNSAGAELTATGTADVNADTVVLFGAGATPNNFGLFFQGDQQLGGGAGLPFGDGLRCVGFNVVRLQIVLADGTGGSQTSVPIAATGGVSAGQTKHYQLWYRDPATSPCGFGFNLSNGLTIAW